MLPFHIYDVFTDTPFSGNPLAIVEQADGLSTAQMQTIARQFNLSETIFIQTPADPAHTAKVRIFTPYSEIPFAGHPTVGCSIHLAPQAQNGTLTLEEVAGLVPVTLTGAVGSERAEFTAPRLPQPIGTAPKPETVAKAIGLTLADMGPHQTGAYQAGPAFLFAQVASLDALDRAAAREPGWSDLLAEAAIDDTGRSAVGLYVYAQGDATDIQARMFAPTDGIPEDPATGSATAILAAQLHANGTLVEGENALSLAQGVEMGRPSRLHLTIDVSGGDLAEIRVAGQAVKISHGHTRVP